MNLVKIVFPPLNIIKTICPYYLCEENYTTLFKNIYRLRSHDGYNFINENGLIFEEWDYSLRLYNNVFIRYLFDYNTIIYDINGNILSNKEYYYCRMIELRNNSYILLENDDFYCNLYDTKNKLFLFNKCLDVRIYIDTFLYMYDDINSYYNNSIKQYKIFYLE